MGHWYQRCNGMGISKGTGLEPKSHPLDGFRLSFRLRASGGSLPLSNSPREFLRIVCQMEHTVRPLRCKVTQRDSKPEDLGGGSNVWIRTARNHSARLCNRLGRMQFV
jgi:hypothetical protein